MLAALLTVAVLAMSVATSPCDPPKPAQRCCPCCPAAQAAQLGKLGTGSVHMRIRIAVHPKQLLPRPAVLAGETDSRQLCEGGSCDRATAFKRWVIAVDPAQNASGSLAAGSVFRLSAMSARPLKSIHNSPPPAPGAVHAFPISLRI
jgi:hypothetical protein